jgi:hypothetical protein
MISDWITDYGKAEKKDPLETKLDDDFAKYKKYDTIVMEGDYIGY